MFPLILKMSHDQTTKAEVAAEPSNGFLVQIIASNANHFSYIYIFPGTNNIYQDFNFNVQKLLD